jgi:hypothetical protein
MLAKRSSSCLSKLLCSTERSGSLRHPFGGQAFPRNVIDDVENAQTPAAGELVVDKVQRPAGIGPCLNEGSALVLLRLVVAPAACAH